MRTDPRAIDGSHFDLLVIGGGIQGAAIAREAAVRGLATLLVEREDFACGTSSRSSRLIHGGVRYLEQGNFGLVREALHERERLLRHAPHLVRPLPMLMPFFADSGKSALLLRLGLKLYGWMAGRSTMPRPKARRVDECVRLFPGLRTRGLKGGVVYYDAATQDTRLTLAVLEAAAEAGAMLVSHVEATGCRDGTVLLSDRMGGTELAVTAGQIVNAAGPTADAVRRAMGVAGDDLVRTTRGSHIVLDPLPCETALAGFLPDGRIQFVIPHPDGTLCGTTDVEEPADGESTRAPTVPEDDVTYLLGALAHMLERPPARADVRFGYCGWRSLPTKKGPPGSLNREAFLVEESCDAGPLHTVVGGKLTTHRSLGERLVRQLFPAVSGPSPTRTTPLPGGEGPAEHADSLWWRHGSRAGAVRALARGEPELLEPICPHRDAIRAEALYGLRLQGAVTFVDLALRRLVDSRGPCTEESCLRELHGLYARACPSAISPDFGRDRDALLDAVRRMAGAAVGTSEVRVART